MAPWNTSYTVLYIQRIVRADGCPIVTQLKPGPWAQLLATASFSIFPRNIIKHVRLHFQLREDMFARSTDSRDAVVVGLGSTEAIQRRIFDVV